MNIPFLNNETIYKLNLYEELIAALRDGFCNQNIVVPQRHHHDIFSNNGESNTLLLMPAWENEKSLGVKIVNVAPSNKSKDLATIQGLYLHFDQSTGTPLAIFDAKALTNIRTAATSALASSVLSRTNSKKLLMVGTGSLAPELVRAHLAVRPFEQIMIWGREQLNAKKVKDLLTDIDVQIVCVDSLEKAVPKADVISVATLSNDPLILGKDVVEGQHIDLVGSFKRNMREGDDALMTKARVYVDTLEGATKESGDLFIPLQNGILEITDIVAELPRFLEEKALGRKSENEITLFKSVGHASEDLIAANYLLRKFKRQ